MAEKQESHDEGVQDDPAVEDESEETEQEGQEEEKTPEQKLADLAAEIKRINTELNQTKRANATLTRQRDEANGKLTKVASDSGEKPEDIANKLAEKDRRLALVEAKARQRQIGQAVAAYLSEHHPLHVDAVEWLPAKVATLMSDDDIAEDGEYDEAVLLDKIEPLAQKYADKNPRQPAKAEKDKSGGAGGEGGRNQKGNGKLTEAELAKQYAELYPALARTMKIGS